MTASESDSESELNLKLSLTPCPVGLGQGLAGRPGAGPGQVDTIVTFKINLTRTRKFTPCHSLAEARRANTEHWEAVTA